VFELSWLCVSYELVQCSNIWFSLNYANILSRNVGKSCIGLCPVFLFELVECQGVMHGIHVLFDQVTDWILFLSMPGW
jgi:hypothetical protein